MYLRTKWSHTMYVYILRSSWEVWTNLVCFTVIPNWLINIKDIWVHEKTTSCPHK
jgi:hypothetical protein